MRFARPENARGREQGLSFLSLTSLVIASMIGAGVFTTSGFALGDLGTPGRVMLAWLVGGGVALCGALSYGALARRMTESGGEYLFLSRAIHPLVGFLAGWVSLLAGFTGAIAFAATAFAAYALPDNVRPSWLSHDVLATLVVVGAGVMHGRHVRGGVLSQNITVMRETWAHCRLSVVRAAHTFPRSQWQGGPVIAPGESTPPPFSFSAFAVTLMWISLSYSGFNAAIYVAGEARHADVIVPRAMVVGTLLVTVLYLALNAVFVYAPAPEAIAQQQDVAARAAFALGGEPLALAVRVIIVVALLTSVSAMVMAGPRVYARMAEDGVLPAIFRMRERRAWAGGGTPSALSRHRDLDYRTTGVVILFRIYALGQRRCDRGEPVCLAPARRRTNRSRFLAIPSSLAALSCAPWALLDWLRLRRPQEPLRGSSNALPLA